jgi:hypothetical protein
MFRTIKISRKVPTTVEQELRSNFCYADKAPI